MKSIQTRFLKVVLPTILLAAFVLTGCGHSSKRFDTTALEKSFRSAGPASKAIADQVVAALKSANYEGALAKINQLIQDEKLSPEQRQACTDLRAHIWKMFVDNPPPQPVGNPAMAPPK